MEDNDSSSSSSEISDSELDDYEAKSYAFLQANSHIAVHLVKNPDGSYRCPFCARIGASDTRKSSQCATHRALARFLNSDLPETGVVPDPRPASPLPDPKPAKRKTPDELLVWPWTGVLANVPLGEPLKERFAKFKPLEVIPLFVKEKQCAVIMRFNKDWSGFRDAMAFENQFKAAGFGRDEWVKGKFEAGAGSLYGWMAREEDFNGDDGVGEHLRRNGKLLTVSEVENEAAKENGKIMELLASQVSVKNQHLQDLECRYNLIDLSLKRILEDKNQVHLAFNEKMRQMQCEAHDTRKVFEENEKLRLELDSKRKELDLRCKELDKLEAQNDGKKQKLDDEKQRTELASIVQKQTDKDVLKLLEEQKREKEAAITKILHIEKRIDHMLPLELEIEQLKGQLLVLKHLAGEEDVDLHNKMEKLNEKMQQETEELEALNNSLVIKERESNDELQEVRKEFITGLDELLKGRTLIGIKRMGELDEKPFLNACKKKFPEDADIKALQLCSSWQEELKKPSWHPYKIVESDVKTEEVIDENDENLRHLRIDLGDDVYNAVKTALLEINEYNPAGRYVVPELWNFKENRKATMKEVVQYLLRHWRSLEQTMTAFPSKDVEQMDSFSN